MKLSCIKFAFGLLVLSLPLVSVAQDNVTEPNND